MVSTISFSALAISEQNYAQNYQDIIKPYFASGKMHTLAGVNKLPIRYQVYQTPDAKNCLLLLPGRQEPLDKYAEIVYDLNHSELEPMTVFVVDHRGQGLSGRMTANPQIGYVDQFEDYVADVKQLFNTHMQTVGCEKFYLMGHSMGGAIGLGLLMTEQDRFAAASFSAPMWMINTKPYPNFVAQMIGGLTSTFGAGKKYAVGQGDYNINFPFEKNNLTHSPERYKMSVDIYREQPLTQVGGVSNRWVLESLKFTKKLRRKASKFTIPMVVMQAGMDELVKPKGQDLICKKAKACEQIIFTHAFHELLMEKDEVRDVALSHTIKLFKNN